VTGERRHLLRVAGRHSPLPTFITLLVTISAGLTTADYLHGGDVTYRTGAAAHMFAAAALPYLGYQYLPRAAPAFIWRT